MHEWEIRTKTVSACIMVYRYSKIWPSQKKCHNIYWAAGHLQSSVNRTHNSLPCARVLISFILSLTLDVKKDRNQRMNGLREPLRLCKQHIFASTGPSSQSSVFPIMCGRNSGDASVIHLSWIPQLFSLANTFTEPLNGKVRKKSSGQISWCVRLRKQNSRKRGESKTYKLKAVFT